MSFQQKKKFGALLSVFSPCGERFLPSGYKDKLSFEEQLQKASMVEDLSGIEVDYPTDFKDAKELKHMVENVGLQISNIEIDLFGDRKWKYGSLCSTDKELRSEAIELCKKGMDGAVELGCNQISLWTGQDGFDYPMQVDYRAYWRNTITAIEEIASYRTDVNICLEYKNKEPRKHIQLGTVGKALSIINSIGAKNIGVMLDMGHAIMAYENPAESAVLLNEFNRLFYVHFNDNYGFWDDDLIPGSVHVWETLEFIYWLEKLGYEGWYTLDIFPFREDPVDTCTQSIKNIKSLIEIARKLDEERINLLQRASNANGVIELLREAVLE